MAHSENNVLTALEDVHWECRQGRVVKGKEIMRCGGGVMEADNQRGGQSIWQAPATLRLTWT